MDTETLILKWVLILCGIPLLVVFGYLHWTMQREAQKKERDQLREDAWKSHWTPEMKKFLFGWFTDPVAISLSERNSKLYKSYADAWQEYVHAWREKRVPELWAQILAGAHQAAYAETARVRREMERLRTDTTPPRPCHVHAEVVRPRRLLLPPAE